MDSGEHWRFFLLLVAWLLGGALTGYWLISLILVLLGYSVWIMFQLRELRRWLEAGAPAKDTPDFNGIWEQIVANILSLQKKNVAQKKTIGILLKRNQGIINALPFAAIMINDHNEIEWTNKPARKWFKLKNKIDRGQRLENLLRIPELNEVLAKGSKEEVEITFPPGSDRYLALQVIPIKKGGKLLLARDITERVRLQTMRRTFIANASHELRTPLTVVNGYLEMLQDDERLPEQFHASVDAAAAQSENMKSIIEDLLSLSRLENSSIKDSELEIIDMPAMLKTQCQNTAEELAQQSHQIEADIDPSLKIRGVPSEIASVCTNLVGNAIRHTPAGTTVKISWQKNDDGMACLSISDNGPGISREHHNRLTERFYRVDKGRSREQGGTGLGLAIVQHIVQRHGGKLEINSEPGQGSTFKACFPI